MFLVFKLCIFLAYGPGIKTLIDDKVKLDPEECEILIKERKFKFKGQEVQVADTKKFAGQIFLYGSRGDAEGDCELSKVPFTVNGVMYKDKWLTVTFSGSVIKEYKSYQTKTLQSNTGKVVYNSNF